MDEENFKEMINALRDEDRDVRLKAVNVLGRMGEQAVEPLIKALKDENSNVQKGAAKALGEIGNARAVEPLVNVLKDKNTKIRFETVEALEKLGWVPRDDTEKAYFLLTKKQWRELARLGDVSVVPLVQALKEEKTDEVRLKVIEALGDMYLTQALKSVRIGPPRKMQKNL